MKPFALLPDPSALRVARRILVLTALMAILGMMMLVNAGAGSQYMCPQAADPEVDAGWHAYRAGMLDIAALRFGEAVGRCPRHVGGRVGLGYVALRDGETEEARALFDAVLARSPDVIDALVGRGIVAWRTGDLERMRALFEQVGRLDPSNAESHRYLALMEAATEVEEAPLPVPPARAPLTIPDTLEYHARAGADRLEVRTRDGWAPFYVRGINLGAALPGRYPSQYPDSATYARWLEAMAETGANTVRVYTRHPPHFYGALRAHNLANPDAPLWLLHGVWAEPPPDGLRFDDRAWEAALLDDVRAAIDIVHGRADVAPAPGKAAGFYTADVSRWTLAWILGPEWEAASIAGFARLRPALTRWDGRYARVADGSAMDAWAARLTDAAVAYETETYRTQRPVAHTGWHTGDATGAARLHAPVPVRATAAFPAGTFASYHVYPGHPASLAVDPRYASAASPFGPSRYFGLLAELRARHAGQPVLVAEYGLPAGIGVAGLSPQGWHQGGLPEDDVARIVARMTREIAAAGMAGGVVFAWIDEWFKSSWASRQLESPAANGRRWYNRLDAQEHYGIVAVEPEPRLPGATLAERLDAWRDVPAAYDDPARGELRLLADEAYLRVLYAPAGDGADELLIGFDLLGPERGNFAWPRRAGARLPVGVDAVLRVADGRAEILHDPAFQPHEIREVEAPGVMPDPPPLPAAPAGLFRGRFAAARPTVSSRVADDGVYEPPRVLVERHAFGPDSTEILAAGYEPGRLRPGPAPDGLWEQAGDVHEFRIPWALLNVSDPSRRRVLQDTRAAWSAGELATVGIDGIRVVAAARSGDRWAPLPASGRADDVALFTWPTWDEPRWRERLRPTAVALREAWSHAGSRRAAAVAP